MIALNLKSLLKTCSLSLVVSLYACATTEPKIATDQSEHHEQHAQHKMSHGLDGHAGMEDHSAHMELMEKAKDVSYIVNRYNYDITNLPLLRMDEQKVSLAEELASDEPILLNFIFTTCTTICPVLSATFSRFQAKLGAEAEKIKMVSISIDPEHDTPAKLREYADKFKAGPQWQFYTGSLAQTVEAQKAFNAYRGSKMNHIPLTFIKVPGNDQWVRLEGFTSAADLLSEYRRLVNS